MFNRFTSILMASAGRVRRVSESRRRGFVFGRPFPVGRKRGFTFIEILAAMLFMGILIPTAIQGILIANRAGVVAERRRTAAQLADRLLTEAVVTEEWRQGDQEGDFGEEWLGFRWSLASTSWEADTMRAITATVFFIAQGREYQAALTTVAEEQTQSVGMATE